MSEPRGTSSSADWTPYRRANALTVRGPGLAWPGLVWPGFPIFTVDNPTIPGAQRVARQVFQVPAPYGRYTGMPLDRIAVYLPKRRRIGPNRRRLELLGNKLWRVMKAEIAANAAEDARAESEGRDAVYPFPGAAEYVGLPAQHDERWFYAFNGPNCLNEVTQLHPLRCG